MIDLTHDNVRIFINAIRESVDIIGFKVQVALGLWYTLRFAGGAAIFELYIQKQWGIEPEVVSRVKYYYALDNDCIEFMLTIAPLKDWIPYYE